MLQYLIVQLCDTSTSYCNYENLSKKQHLISLDDLKAGIFFAMKENLMLQFVYPDKELPMSYKELINTIDHNDIISSLCEDKELTEKADVIVFNDWIGLSYYRFSKEKTYVIRTSKDDFFDRYKSIKQMLDKVKRINIVFNDVEKFRDEDFIRLKKTLSFLSADIQELSLTDVLPQVNLLTDRLSLHGMNNCDAGWKNITLAPDGCFYVCPAFYLNKEKSVGDVHSGLMIKNPQLYRMEYAPICRHCDAFQCKRCIWLNKKMTLEVNTPSHEQCVISHIERNVSREMLKNLNIKKLVKDPSEIKEITYLDPLEIREDWDRELLQKELVKYHKENY